MNRRPAGGHDGEDVAKREFTRDDREKYREDPLAMLDKGDTTGLSEFKLHNGTIYRWNRSVYDVVRDKPHLRVENRALPAGSTIVDALANAVLYFGLIRALAEDERPLWSQMSFQEAEENFHAVSRNGLDAQMYWPGVGTVPVAELVLRRLLPLAHEGLIRWGGDSSERDRLLDVIEQRCLSGVNGDTWQTREFHRHYDHTHLDQADALRTMLRSYVELRGLRAPQAHEGGHIPALATSAEFRFERLQGKTQPLDSPSVRQLEGS